LSYKGNLLSGKVTVVNLNWIFSKPYPRQAASSQETYDQAEK